MRECASDGDKIMKRATIGGQAVMEGVMMKAPEAIAVAVRNPNGEIITKVDRYIPPSKNNKVFGWPIIRGVVNFVDMMRIGMGTMTYSAEIAGEETEEPSKFEKWLAGKLGKNVDQVVIGIAVILGILLAVGIFILLPQFLTSLFTKNIESNLLKNLIEGAIRLTVFISYMVAISFIKDIKRVFMYHGAEHKVIACYEAEEELSIENVRKHVRFHARCGTNYMFLVMMVSILFFSLIGWSDTWLMRVASRLIFLPVVAGVSYEVLKLAAASDGLIARIVRWPGVALQRITTLEPTDDMIEVAVTAFKLAENPLSASEPDGASYRAQPQDEITVEAESELDQEVR